MTNTARFESQEQKINAAIEKEVKNICEKTQLVLPGRDVPVVNHYIKKIEGKYDVSRSKKDTDNAIQLLYIAYNTTPQANGSIRVKISGIMSSLITAQQDSELTMKKALGIAVNIQSNLSNYFPDWLDVKETDSSDEIKSYVVKDLRELASEIKQQATEVQQDLNSIAEAYETIIVNTKDASSSSEKALSQSLADKAAIEKEINESNARREQLDSLVTDLQAQVTKFEKMARDFESRAKTAEERAFVMSIIKVGAEMVTAALPAIAMAAGGPGSVLAASTMNTVNQATSNQNGEAGTGDKPTENTTEGSKQSDVELRTNISKMEAKKEASEAKKKEILDRIKDLENEKAKLIESAETSSEDGDAKDATEKTDKGDVEQSTEVKALDDRIAEANKELEAETDNSVKIGSDLAGLNASLKLLSESLGEMSKQQQDQASSLREMQMQMLNKAEEYENEKRNQTAELIKIKALLKGSRTEEETIQLAVKSLNLSLSALKRAQEIIQEIAFFFKSFADYMGQVSQEANLQVKSIDKTAEKTTLRKNSLARVILMTDEFFIKQSAQWYAVTDVSDKFCQNFADGWSKLNKLNGTYITGDKLTAYLEDASVKLNEIAEEREQASASKVAYINEMRSELGKAG